ncbi:MAG: hypothetical protein J6Y94_02960, partial [Bacteriovoracaceae bacterium]|nr:hypothetical protein [Bacteriovoracaceae bacterium]
MQLVLKTWCLVTCLFLFLSSAVVNASESPCPDNLLPPPEKISTKDHNLIESILNDLNGENFTPLKKHIRRNLRLLRRYHHLMAQDQDLARKILRFVEFSPSGSDEIEDLATAQQYYTLFNEITLQNITPLTIKPGEVTAESPDGFTINLEYLGVKVTNSDEVKVYSAVERFLNAIFSSSGNKDVSSRYKRWLALLENEQEQYLKFDGEKFYLDKSKNGAITAEKFEQQLERQRELKLAFEQLKEDIPFFFRSNREIGNLFAQQKSFRDLGQLWKKFNDLAHKLSNNEALIKLINHDLINENNSLPDELRSHLKRYKIEALSTKVFVQRLARIYNLYLRAIRNRISKILSDLITNAKMNSWGEIDLSSRDASREIRDILYHYEGSIVENNDQRRPFSISTLELKFKAESIPGMRFSGNIEKWREVIWHAEGEYLPLGPDHLYLLQILKLVIETFDRNQSLEHLTLTINDPNDVIINDARMGKFATQKDCGGWAYGGYNSWGAHPGNGLVVIGADNFCNRKVFSLSALVHELHHTITRNNGLYLFPSTTRIEGPLYANQFAISEITARLTELEHLRKQFEILIQVLHHPENDPDLTDSKKMLFYSLLQ